MTKKAKPATTLADLTPDPQNARKHNARNIGQVQNSLQKYGAARSIVIDENNQIIAGHGVVEAAALAGIERVQVVEADGETIVAVRRTGLTKKQKQELGIADNRAGDLSEWDGERLAELMGDIDLGQFFTADELAELVPEPEGNDAEDPGADVDRAAELQEKWQTAPGQLWQIGRHRLLVGDCTVRANVERLMGGERAAVGFFDPPYGIDFQSNARTASAKFEVLHGDRVIDGSWIAFAVEYLNDAGAMYVCTRWDVYPEWRQLIEPHIRLKNVIVWDKVDWSSGDLEGDYSPRHEFILFCVKGRHLLRGHRDSNVWAFGAMNKQNYLHPTQKLVEVPACALEKSSSAGDIVMDWFVGSGTSIVAAEKVGRTVYAMEISPAYAAVTLERLTGLGLDAHKVDA